MMLHESCCMIHTNFEIILNKISSNNPLHRSRGLTAIPRAFPQDATVIDMSHNQIKTLGEISPLEGNG